MHTRRQFLSCLPVGALGVTATAMSGGRRFAAEDVVIGAASHADVCGWDPSANSSPASEANPFQQKML